GWAPWDSGRRAAERGRPGNERRPVDRVAAAARREPAARRQARCEQLAGGRERRLAVLAEARDAVVRRRTDVLRQLEVLVLQIPARTHDRLPRAVRELQR